MMNRPMVLVGIGWILLAASASAWGAGEGKVYSVLLVDGQNNHDWRSTTPLITFALERSGRFAVTVATTPPTDAPQAEWAKFRPVFSKYDAVISNFTDFGAKPSPTQWLEDLAAYVRGGGALVVVHAATSGMDHYKKYARLVGMGWHDAAYGDRLYVDESGRTIRQTKGQGPGTAHGPPFSWAVTMWPGEHPICVGLPRLWMHEVDELWAAPRGPAENVEVIATAVAPETKQNEPVMWTVRYGKGRVFVTMLGHHAQAMKCVGFQVTLARGCEWAIDEKVTIAAPDNFPKADTLSTVDKISTVEPALQTPGR